MLNFRNFKKLELEFLEQQVLLWGANGVGKTNILEALTLLGRSQSLRSAKMEEMILKIMAESSPDSLQGSQNDFLESRFEVYGEIKNHNFLDSISIVFDGLTKKKSLKLNGELYNQKRQSDLKSQFLNFIFLTPQIEQLFVSDKSVRRDYLDKIVCDLDNLHQNRLHAYQKLLKERIAILQNHSSIRQKDQKTKIWLEIVENKIVELGTAIAAARVEAVNFFNRAIESFYSNFPRIYLAAKGDVEQSLQAGNLVTIEENYRQKLAQNRQVDAEESKTNFGIHRSDFDANFVEKNMSIALSSTGEQKLAMISITLARAKIAATYKNQPTILIFDEVASHLDQNRKSNLFAEIIATNLQSFFSATDFDMLPSNYLNKTQKIKIE